MEKNSKEEKGKVAQQSITHLQGEWNPTLTETWTEKVESRATRLSELSQTQEDMNRTFAYVEA